MPARRKRAGTAMAVSRAAAKKLAALALDMEVPLNDAIDAVQALRLIGHGLAQHGGDDEGRAVAAIAWTACQRLDTLRETWRSLCKLAARTK